MNNAGINWELKALQSAEVQGSLIETRRMKISFYTTYNIIVDLQHFIFKSATLEIAYTIYYISSFLFLYCTIIY